MKPLVIYHANCADGFGAAFAAWLKFGDEAEYLPMQYGQVKETDIETWPKDCTGREVYILDFSLPKPVMEVLFDVAARVIWLDHHKSAFEVWCPGETQYFKSTNQGPEDPWRHYVLLDNNKSGAYLAWEFFHPGTEVPMLIKHIDDYDRWQFKLDGTKAFNKALWSYAPWSFEQWRNWLREEHDIGLDWMYNDGEAILRAHDQNVQSVVKGSARECEISTGPLLPHMHDGLAANCPPHLTSDVGHELANQYGTFGLCWTLSQECMTAKCSLRSNGDYDVSVIAKSFGGGGHKNAAGFEVPIETLLGWLK